MEKLKSNLPYLAGAIIGLVLALGKSLPPSYATLVDLVWLIPAIYLLAKGAVAIRKVAIEPCNYVAIDVGSTGINYTNLSRDHIFIGWNEISKIRFVRDEALFPDLSGPYNETYWSVHTKDGKFIEIMDEYGNRFSLLLGFRKSVKGFSLLKALIGILSFSKGIWSCYEESSLPHT